MLGRIVSMALELGDYLGLGEIVCPMTREVEIIIELKPSCSLINLFSHFMIENSVFVVVSEVVLTMQIVSQYHPLTSYRITVGIRLLGNASTGPLLTDSYHCNQLLVKYATLPHILDSELW